MKGRGASPPKARRFGLDRKGDDKRISVKGARTQLISLLVQARSIEHFTAEGLARMHRISVKECGERLEAERKRRQGVLL